MVASVTYQERMFDTELKRMNVEYLLRTRDRFDPSKALKDEALMGKQTRLFRCYVKLLFDA
jgi:hypothetical protein